MTNWYHGCPGGPIRNAIDEVLKPVVAPEASARIAVLKTRTQEKSMGRVPPHIIPPQGGSVLALPYGRITMQEAADALALAFGGRAGAIEPYTPQPDYEGMLITIEGYTVTLPEKGIPS